MSLKNKRVKTPVIAFLGIAQLSLLVPAYAQRADENAVLAADDAFGVSVGDEAIGFYDRFNVRGFSPTDAGNLRIEGLAIDLQTGLGDRLVGSTTIRVGLSAQGYLLPAPTGIADFSLRRVGDRPTQSFVFERSGFGGYDVQADFQKRLAEGAVELTFGAATTQREGQDGTVDIESDFGGTVRFQPSAKVDMTVFGNLEAVEQDERFVLYFPAGPTEPPKVERRKFVGQSWTSIQSTNYNIGFISKYQPAIADFQLGVFRSVSEGDQQTGPFFTNIQANGFAEKSAFLGPSTESASTSLEARAARKFIEGNRQHTFTANIRARERDQRFGGTTGIDLGTGFIEVRDFVPKPDVSFGPQTTENVEQITYGASYNLKWINVGELNLGIQQSDYTRTIIDPERGEIEGTEEPLLYNVTGSVELQPWLTAYGGVVKGFEEGPVAPSNAVNRNLAPPAIETEQADLGVRVALGPLTGVAGVFQIERPFFGVDDVDVFRQRGDVTNRGVELSLAGAVTREVQMVLGTVLIDSKLSGDAVANGELSEDPIAAIRRVTTVDLDYQPEKLPGWSFDLSVNSRGEQNGDEQGQFVIDPRTIVDIGSRRQFVYGDRTLVIRSQINNLFDTYGWEVWESGAFVYETPRSFSISLRADL
ncbi:MAG: TonB-dependent receptor [Pseudomonadota bacterium]